MSFPQDEKYWTDYYANHPDLKSKFELIRVTPIGSYKIKYGEIPNSIPELQAMIGAYIKKKYGQEWEKHDIGYISDIFNGFTALTRGRIEYAITSDDPLYEIYTR
eukprot:Phypoly_transcript_28943.p1 GENE.Phypoly_transcript_28943~~Phypoly_transcript_28943.p1  ORF type:complete len:116 (+),score=8.86 Phypoly_transcript_28943:36-350(+)